MRIRIAALLCSLVTTVSTHADDVVPFDIPLDENSKALHLLLNTKVIQVVPAFEDYTFMLFDLCDAMELSISGDCLIYPMNSFMGGNAIATEHEGDRLIIYDRELSPVVGSDGAMTIIAHELGHHYCRHLHAKDRTNHQLELEADFFAGAAMRKAGYTLNGVLDAVAILDERPSMSHPKRSERIAALTNGWNNPATAKDCSQGN